MRIIIPIAIIVFAFSCKSNNPNEQVEQIRTYDTSTFYYDIPLAVKLDLDESKRLLMPAYAITKYDGKVDSVAVDTNAVQQLAAPFIQYNLNESRFKKFYKEDRYEDGDIRKIVFNYSTNNYALPIRTATIWLDNETQDLSNIIVKRIYTSKDTTYDEDLTWTAGRSFMILQKATAGGKEFIKQTNVYWKK